MTTSTKPHPRLSSRLGALSLLTIALVFGASAVPAASTTPQHAEKSNAKVAYVALGDSFTSGQGAPPYRKGPCLQSKRASYPVITASLSTYKLVANQSCSGARTSDVITQVAQLPAKLKGPNSPVRLVTLTVGGIDAGSNDVLAACFAWDGINPACPAAVTFAIEQLESGILVSSLAATYAEAARAMPNATIVVFTYPSLFDENFDDNLGGQLVGFVNFATGALNQNIEGAALAAAAAVPGLAERIQVVDVTDEFSERGIGGTPPWISFDPLNLTAPANFHPNALGNSGGYAAALLAAVPPG